MHFGVMYGCPIKTNIFSPFVKLEWLYKLLKIKNIIQLTINYSCVHQFHNIMKAKMLLTFNFTTLPQNLLKIFRKPHKK